LPSSSSKSVAPLHLILEHSRWLETLVISAHGLALVAALANPLSGWIKLGLVFAIAISLPLSWRQLTRARGITLNSEGDWEVILPSGSLLAHLGPGTLVTPWIVILGLRTERQHLSIPICRDAVDPESFRRLRVYLQIAGETAH
jgi:hypothetical protein